MTIIMVEVKCVGWMDEMAPESRSSKNRKFRRSFDPTLCTHSGVALLLHVYVSSCVFLPEEMTERFATNTPPVVPSNAAASGHGQPHHPAHQSFVNTGKHAQVGQHQLQPTIYYFNPQVQQVVHSRSQHVQQGQRAFTSPQSTTQPLTT